MSDHTEALGRTPGEWQPIETAPKDGRLILLHPSRCWSEDAEPFDCEVGYWDKDVLFGGGWIAMGPTADDYTGPTHWHPLPSLAAQAGRTPQKARCIIGEYCRDHGFVHGAEAEELREHLEAYIKEQPNARVRDLQAVLDAVDARDSLAYSESGEAGQIPPALRSPDQDRETDAATLSVDLERERDEAKRAFVNYHASTFANDSHIEREARAVGIGYDKAGNSYEAALYAIRRVAELEREVARLKELIAVECTCRAIETCDRCYAIDKSQGEPGHMGEK